MTTSEFHLDSEGLANAAHEAIRAGEVERARTLFADAAAAEAKAFEAVPDSKPRTMGILAVSATALWFKAGDYQAAELFAHRASLNTALPFFAQQELRELLRAIWDARVPHDAGFSAAPGQSLILHGNLRALDLDQGYLRISVDGASVRIFGVGDAVDRAVGPMVDHDVDVRVVGGDEGDLRFVDIAPSVQPC